MKSGLSNFEIESLFKDEIGFQGCFMRNEPLPKYGSFILNLDDLKGEGTHWVAVHADKKLYYDSYGIAPPMELEGIKFKDYNLVQHQKLNSGLCALYCMYFIYRLNRGIDFYTINYIELKHNGKKNNYVRLKNLLSEMQKED